MVLVRIGMLLGLMTPASIVGSDAIVRERSVNETMLTAKIFYPAESLRRRPGILVIGGAEGGSVWAESTARMLSDQGYVALAESYFKSPGLPANLQLVPMERFRAGINRLASDPRVDRRRVAVVGLSKGAEAALLIASRDSRVRAVVAGSPSDVVWQGIDRSTGEGASSWSSAGRPLPFIPFARCTNCKSLAALYSASHAGVEVDSPAVIPVENIRGPILMIASERDAVWPSEPMADAIAKRLAQRRFNHEVQILRYPDGGHFTLGPLAPADAEMDAAFGGGTPEGVVAARRNSWSGVLSFLNRALWPNKGNE